MKICPACGFQSPSDTDCLKCGIVFSKYVAPLVGEPTPPEGLEIEPEVTSVPAAPSEPAWLLLGSLPGALIFAWISGHVPPLRILLDAFRLCFHELGHGLIGWLSGRRALPLPIGWTNVEEERSILVYLLVTFLTGVGIWKSAEKKMWIVVAFLVGMFVLQTYLTFGWNSEQFNVAMAYGGIGGEFYLGTILAAWFFLQGPDKTHWKWMRWIVLAAGTYSLLTTYLHWIDISHERASIPWGTLFQGEGDAGGDMNRLYDEYGWRKQEIVRIYLKTGMVCSIGLGLAYVASVVRYFLGRRSG
jgi:hypothetical protein